ncbi:MAG: hypothetical protein U5J83_02295 [Bryobacterales bacterium]|nr:hypothetical protein [Bryobacterales bacterium]
MFNAATSFGAILAPFVVGWIVYEDGTTGKIPFLITGVYFITLGVVTGFVLIKSLKFTLKFQRLN